MNIISFLSVAMIKVNKFGLNFFTVMKSMYKNGFLGFFKLLAAYIM